MKVAVIGSRNLTVSDIDKYIPVECKEIVSGGARGIDKCAEEYAKKKGLILTVFLPDYNKFGRGAPIVRNKQIVDYADKVIAFWDGSSRGTKSVIDYCQRIGKECRVILLAL